MSFAAFERELEREERELFEKKIGQVKRRIALSAMNGVVEMSPVGNPSLWQSPAPPGYTGGTFRANWDMSPANGLGTIFQTVTIENDLPYAMPLENGHSTQAPQGIVAVTLSRLESQFAVID